MTIPPLLRCGTLLIACCAVVVSHLRAADAAQLQEARELFHQRHDAEAQAAFTRIAAEDPKLAEAPYHLGLLALRRSAPEEAVKFLESATTLDPASCRYRLRLGDAYGMTAAKAGIFSKLGLAKKCRGSYEQAVKLDPQSIEAHWSLMEYYKQAPGFAGGSFAKALEQADQIAVINASAGRFARAGVYTADEEFEKAFALYDGVLTAEPPEYAALGQLAQLALNTGRRLDDGIAAAQRCLQLPEQPKEPTHAHVHAFLGRLQEKKGDKTAARAAYQVALVLDPKFKEAADALKRLE